MFDDINEISSEINLSIFLLKIYIPLYKKSRMKKWLVNYFECMNHFVRNFFVIYIPRLTSFFAMNWINLNMHDIISLGMH